MNTQNLSEEDQFLLSVCIEFEQNNTSQIPSEFKKFNWEKLLQKANAHGLIPLIHLWCLRHGVSENIPIQRITGVYNQVLALNVVLENAYAEVSKELLNNELSPFLSKECTFFNQKSMKILVHGN
jgi:hypothetical protein